MNHAPFPLSPPALLAAHDQATLWPEFRPQPVAADLASAYQTALAVRALRVLRGERPLGYKIGFTNRGIWQRYGVYAPIWGTVWDSTLLPGDGPFTLLLNGLCQPRLEPEVVFGMAATPPENATLEQLFACVDWLAPGFEVVQTHAPGWKFSAAETVADGGLHGRLMVGVRQSARALADSGEQLDAQLAATRVQLLCNDQPVDDGVGANVLDGPLHALHHFVLEQQGCPGAPRLRAGDVVTTGTWTDAWPLQAGQHWQARFDAPLGSLTLRVA